MRVLLLHRDRDFDFERPAAARAEELREDLELETLLGAMSDGDGYLADIAARVLPASLEDPGEIAYRQDVLRDLIAKPGLASDLYETSVEADQARRQAFWGYHGASPETVLHGAVRVLAALMGAVVRLRGLADTSHGEVASEGLRRFLSMVREELDDAWLRSVREQLSLLGSRDLLISAALGSGNLGTAHVVRRPRTDRRGLLERLPIRRRRDRIDFEIPPRDESGLRALRELRGRGIAPVAAALAQATEHIAGFFEALRAELGFYVACLNLHRRLAGKGEPICFPEVTGAGESAMRAAGLYDPCLSLVSGGRAVGNDLAADGRPLIVMTGANGGGKSTLLRAIGLAQLMAQCGMFAAAESLRTSACTGIFTHWAREEDAEMRRGRLDEELERLSAIADGVRPGGMVLCNEPFASTNEREGSQIGREVVRALLDCSVRVVLVTHLYELARELEAERNGEALFLRAEREPDGRRTFVLAQGGPLPTAFGADLHERVFGEPPHTVRAAAVPR